MSTLPPGNTKVKRVSTKPGAKDRENDAVRCLNGAIADIRSGRVVLLDALMTVETSGNVVYQVTVHPVKK